MSKPRTCSEMMQQDIEDVCRRLRPDTVGCFDLPEVSLLPARALIASGGTTWLVDASVGRVESMLRDHIARLDNEGACLASHPSLDGVDLCASYIPTSEQDRACQTPRAVPRDLTQCQHFAPGRRLRVLHGDSCRGRSAAFSTRVETLVATAATPAAAVDAGMIAARHAAELDVRLPVEDGAFELAISVLAPSQLMERPFHHFDAVMTRRFGPWTTLLQESVVDQLRIALFRSQLDAYMRELARVTRLGRGRLYFATMPVEASADGWLLERGVTECFESLATWFAFDFDTFAPETFLRRCDNDGGVLQTALMRRKQPTGEPP